MNFILKFEVFWPPPSLFEKSGHRKHTLADWIVQEVNCLPDANTDEFETIVVDGGYLIL